MDATFQRAFEQSKHIVFLTGAGVSTPSGIPEFIGLITGYIRTIKMRNIILVIAV